MAKLILFDPVTAGVALAGTAAVGSVAGGLADAKADRANTKAIIKENAVAIKNERLAAARDLRDEKRSTEQDIARLKAVAAAGGASLSDVGFQSLAARVLTESNIRRGRIADDSEANVQSLLTRSKNEAKASKRRQTSAIIGGVAGGAGSLFNIFGAPSGGGGDEE